MREDVDDCFFLFFLFVKFLHCFRKPIGAHLLEMGKQDG